MASILPKLLRGIAALGVVVAATGVALTPASADVLEFDFLMDGDQQVPPVVTNADGYGVLWLDDVTGEFYLHASFRNLDGDVTGAHLHGPADVGQTAGVLIALTSTGLVDGSLTGSGTLDPTQVMHVVNGMSYVNIHTTANTDGEIRGQVEPITAMRRFGFGADGDQVVPVVPTAATGEGSVWISVATGRFVVKGTYSGLESDATAASLHGPADVGSNGNLIEILDVGGGTDGDFFGHGMLTGPQLAAFLDGRTYVAVSTVNFPAGEIRGQNWNLRMLPLEPGIAGTDNLVQVTDAGPYTLLSLAYSTVSGATDVPGCFGVQVMLIQPKIFASATTDLNGYASLTRFVPPPASGLTVYLQVLEAKTCAPSNLLSQPFP